MKFSQMVYERPDMEQIKAQLTDLVARLEAAESYEAAKTLLSENRDVMDKIAEFLIEKETITGKEFMKIFRELKGIPEPEEKKEEKADEAKEEDTTKEESVETTEEVVEESAAEEVKDNETTVEEE